jgi:hypothetical protein
MEISFLKDFLDTCLPKKVLVPLLLGVNLDETNPKNFEGLPLSNSHELKSLYKTYFDGFSGLWKWKSPLTAYGRGEKGSVAQSASAIILIQTLFL